MASLDSFRKALAEKENRVAELEAKLADVRKMQPPPLSPEEEQKRTGTERLRACHEKSEELRNKILQRRDKFLRAQGLDELVILLQGEDPEGLIVGLMTIPSLVRIDFDKEKFEPLVIAALRHEDAEVRREGLNCLETVCSKQESLDILLPMAKDPSPEIRGWVATQIGPMGRNYQREEVKSALHDLLQDEDTAVRWQAVGGLSYKRGVAEKAVDAVIQMSKDPENAERALPWLGSRYVTSAKIAERLVELYDEGHKGRYAVEWVSRRLDREAKPLARDFCIQVVTESIDHYERSLALQGLRWIGDASVIPELEAIAQSDDAEGIGDELARTIESLQNRANEVR